MAIPQIKPPFVAFGQQARAFQFKILAAGAPTSYGVIGALPDGLSVNVTTGLITGTPTAGAVGVFNIPVTATNADGTGSADVVFTIYATGFPFYTGPATLQILQGTEFTLTMAGDWANAPTSFTMVPVPPGMFFDTSTGTLTGGADTVPDKYLGLAITATNGTGTGENIFSVVVQPTASVPVITSPPTITGPAGVPLEYSITATGNPTSFDADPLPPGATWKPSGKVRWVNPASGTFVMTVSATNDFGTDSLVVTWTITGDGGGGGGGGPPPEPPPEVPPLPFPRGGITYGNAKASIATVTDNGVDPTDPRVMRRTNEAINELLITTDPRTGAALIPVNCMAKFDVATDSHGYLLLPNELENVVEAQVVKGDAYADKNISQGFINLLTPFTYLDPSQMHDNPLEDFGLVPHPANASVLRRQMRYPGISSEALVRVVGKKRYVPITTDNDYLIIQNVPAIKLAIQAIEFRENSDPANAKLYWDWAVKLLSDEVVNHRMDPTDYARRKAVFEQDLITYPHDSVGWTVARLALEVPGAQQMGRLDLYRLCERAEMRAIEMGTYKGTLEEFDAEVVGGVLYMPARVESVYAFSLDGQPMNVRSIFWKYLQQRGCWDCTCGGTIEDEGEVSLGGVMRRKFRVFGGITAESAMQMRAVCKLRWFKKQPGQMMTIRNLDAMRLLCDTLINEAGEKWDQARLAKAQAKESLDKQLREYVGGVQKVYPQPRKLGVKLGGVL